MLNSCNDQKAVVSGQINLTTAPGNRNNNQTSTFPTSEIDQKINLVDLHHYYSNAISSQQQKTTGNNADLSQLYYTNTVYSNQPQQQHSNRMNGNRLFDRRITLNDITDDAQQHLNSSTFSNNANCLSNNSAIAKSTTDINSSVNPTAATVSDLSLKRNKQCIINEDFKKRKYSLQHEYQLCLNEKLQNSLEHNRLTFDEIVDKIRSQHYSSITDSNDISSADIVRFNAGGKRYAIELQSLKRYPTSVLGKLAVDGYFDNQINPTWIDRDGDAFAIILNFYRVGKIVLSNNVSKAMINDEIAYFRLPIRQSDFYDETEIFWIRCAKIIKKNIRNEVLQGALVTMAYKRDPRLEFFYKIEDKMKVKTSCLDAAHVVCPYCKQIVFYHFSEWECPIRRHPGQ